MHQMFNYRAWLVVNGQIEAGHEEEFLSIYRGDSLIAQAYRRAASALQPEPGDAIQIDRLATGELPPCAAARRRSP